MITTQTGEIIIMRTPYNYDTDEVSKETGLDCGTVSKTQQQFKDEVDINTIVERFGKAGQMPEKMNFPTAQEFEETFDFQTALNKTIEARESFMTMPAKARARFNNDPQKFMEFIHDPENAQEAVKLGLAIVRKEPEKPEEKPATKAPEKKE